VLLLVFAMLAVLRDQRAGRLRHGPSPLLVLLSTWVLVTSVRLAREPASSSGTLSSRVNESPEQYQSG
jgi:hypothetical protein